jgi:tRNA threonylcarbamoyladenosine biosynthesis protein TsaE
MPNYSILPHQYYISLIDEVATQALGKALAAYVHPGWIMYLYGDLGTGKTTLTRALLRALGVTGTLRSPSYALLEPYEVASLETFSPAQGATLHHFDFYRLENHPNAWKEAGFASAFEPPHAAIVEWPNYAQGLPSPHVSVTLRYNGNGRLALIESNTALAAVHSLI